MGYFAGEKKKKKEKAKTEEAWRPMSSIKISVSD